MKGSTLFIALFLSVAAVSCNEDEPVLPPEPEIKLLSVSPKKVLQFQDSIVFKIQFQDGDGDIGYVNADSLPLTIQDKRLDQPDKFHVPPMAPLDEDVPIQGTFSFTLQNTFLLGNGEQETTTYSIRLKDRAGNWSNEVRSDEITIKEN